jgi:hypothetical protein
MIHRAALAVVFWSVLWFLTRYYTAGWELTAMITAAGLGLFVVPGLWLFCAEELEGRTIRYQYQGTTARHVSHEPCPSLQSWLSFTGGWAIALTILSIALNFALETFTPLSIRPTFLHVGPNDIPPLLAAGAVFMFWWFFTGNFRWIVW